MRIKQIFKNILSVAAAVALFLLCGKCLQYLLIDDTQSYTRVMMHQLYHAEQNIDTLFVGSSHVYRSLVPEIADQSFGSYTFNAGTSTQKMDGSFALIREAASCNHLRQVYLELYYGVAEEASLSERSEMRSTYIISDYMQPSLRKLQYLAEASPKEYLINSFIPARRNWTGLFDPSEIISLIRKKNTDAYRNHEWTAPESTDEFYIDRGFVGNEGSAEEDPLWFSTAYGNIVIPEDPVTDHLWFRSLKRIVDFCRRRNIELVFFIAPEQEADIAGKENYQQYHDFVCGIAEDFGVPFYDFNLCRPAFFDANDRSLFKDGDHLNTRGAEVFTQLAGDFFSGRIDEKDLFYGSVEEKLADSHIPFYGIAGPENDVEENRKHCRIISGCPDAQFQVTAVSSDGIESTLLDYSAERSFSLPADSSGTLFISWRFPGQGDVVTAEVDY